MERVVLLCRQLDTGALEQRSTAWHRWHVARRRSQPQAEVKAIGAAVPAYAAVHSQVLQDVLARLDKT